MSRDHDIYSVKILHKGPGNWPALRGEIYESDVLIGTFRRGACRAHFVPPIEYTFYSTQARNRFDDYADCLSIGETIEALVPRSNDPTACYR